MRDLCNRFLHSKRLKCDSGELSLRSYRDYRATTDLLIKHFGKARRVDDLRPDDFERLRHHLAKNFSVVTLGNVINRVRIVFRYAAENELTPRPVRFGQSFNRPSAKTLRKSRNDAGVKLFDRHELRTILDALAGKAIKFDDDEVILNTSSGLRAMVLLGINCGFGNTDVASLPRTAVNLNTGWIDFPRPKTGVPRRIPIWPETADALREAADVRADAFDPEDDKLWFLTAQGRPWVRIRQSETLDGGLKAVAIDALSQRFARILKHLRINGRSGRGFYTLRHCFETYAGASQDQVAIDSIMGHVDNSMAAHYRHAIGDDRLKSVVMKVHSWLFG